MDCGFSISFRVQFLEDGIFVCLAEVGDSVHNLLHVSARDVSGLRLHDVEGVFVVLWLDKSQKISHHAVELINIDFSGAVLVDLHDHGGDLIIIQLLSQVLEDLLELLIVDVTRLIGEVAEGGLELLFLLSVQFVSGTHFCKIRLDGRQMLEFLVI